MLVSAADRHNCPEGAPSARDAVAEDWQPGSGGGARVDPCTDRGGRGGVRGPKSIVVSYHLSECNKPSAVCPRHQLRVQRGQRERKGREIG